MPTIIPVIEGEGEIDAFPILLRRILHERLARWDVSIALPISSRGRGRLTREGGVEEFVEYASIKPSCDAVIVELDADVDCPKTLALSLAERVRRRRFAFPVAVIAARHAYEAWFLASLETLAGLPLHGRSGLAAGLTYSGDAEAEPAPKRRLDERFSADRTYRETSDMAPLTAHLDLALVFNRCRSFQRLVHAVEEILAFIDSGQAAVTPGHQ